MLICLRGKGYTYTWPAALGPTPWKDEPATKFCGRINEPVGMVTAAPMSGDWFHQHFGVSQEPLRLTAWHGANNQRVNRAGVPGEALLDYSALDLKKGRQRHSLLRGRPVRSAEFRTQSWPRKGLASRMDAKLYELPE